MGLPCPVGRRVCRAPAAHLLSALSFKGTLMRGSVASLGMRVCKGAGHG